MKLKELLNNAKTLGFDAKEDNECVWFIYKEGNRELQQFIPKKSEDSSEFLKEMEHFLSKIKPDLNNVGELRHYTNLLELKNHLKDCLEKGITLTNNVGKLEDYERYQLEWMIDHGHSLESLIDKISKVASDELTNDGSMSFDKIIYEAFEIFEEEVGFDSEIWACKDEWRNNDKVTVTVSGDNKSNYMMLSRLQQDCEYFLGYGNRNDKNLWAGSAREQIDRMKEIYNSFPDEKKPEWISMEDIENYEQEMCNLDELEEERIGEFEDELEEEYER